MRNGLIFLGLYPTFSPPTLPLPPPGPATVEDAPDAMVTAATDRINSLLESFMGINDIELAATIWDLGQGKTNPSDFAVSLDNSEIGAFGFSDELVFDLWGCITDAKAGRLGSGDGEGGGGVGGKNDDDDDDEGFPTAGFSPASSSSGSGGGRRKGGGGF